MKSCVMVLIACIIIDIIGYRLIKRGVKDEHDGEVSGTGFIMLTVIVYLFIIPCLFIAPIQCRKEVYEFKEMKAFYETYETDNYIDEADKTRNVIRLNLWLAEAKAVKIESPAYSFMPIEVLQLEPIR